MQLVQKGKKKQVCCAQESTGGGEGAEGFSPPTSVRAAPGHLQWPPQHSWSWGASANANLVEGVSCEVLNSFLTEFPPQSQGSDCDFWS